MKRILNELGERFLSDISPAVITELREKLSDTSDSTGRKRSPSTLNRYMALLSHILNIAVREWQWLDDSPMKRVRKLKEPRGRVRFLSDDERIALLKACEESESEWLELFVVIALSTGMRKGEIQNLTWDD